MNREADLLKRAAHLKALPRGWDTYQGDPPDPATVDKAVEFAMALADFFPTYEPQLVPCSDGTVQVEWHADGWDVELWVSRFDA